MTYMTQSLQAAPPRLFSAARVRPYVATPLGAQRARPSLQLSESEIVALVGCHANHVVRRQHHCQRCKRGQLLPRMLCGSTTAFRFGGLPCESRGSLTSSTTRCGADGGNCYPECCAEAPYASTHTGKLRCLDTVFSPTASALLPCVIAAQLLRGACCKHLWVCRRSPLQRNSF